MRKISDAEAQMLKASLIRALLDTFEKIGCPPPAILDETKPAALKDFDSPLWRQAMNVLGDLIGTPIPDDVNVFLDKKSGRKLGVLEIVDRLAEIVGRMAA